MAVGIVTDSISDLPPQLAGSLGITVVPLIVGFGSESYRDGVDLTAEQFYEKLKYSISFPVTSVPSPTAFTEAFDKLAEKEEGILAITLSSKLSGTYDAALQGRTLMKNKCRVEVLDSQTATMAEGFIAMKAAEAARRGASLHEVMAIAQKNVPRVGMLAAFDTLEYLKRGGRIGAAKVLLGSMLKINPLITLEDGVVKPAGRTRSRAKAMQRLYEFAGSYSFIEELAVENTACPEEAEALAERLGSIFPKERIHRSKMTPVIGAHTGPGLLLVAVLGDRKIREQAMGSSA